MNEIEFVQILKNEGWKSGKDDAGDYFCILEMEESLLQIIPTIKKRADHFRVSLMPSLTTKNFSKVIAFIMDDKSNFCPIVVSNIMPKKLACIEKADVIRLANEAVTWASEQSLEKGLKKYEELPTDSKGILPLRHLTALAVNKDIKKLSNYIDSFNKGDRLGFIPYIKLEMIERALLIAKNEI